MVVTRSHKSVDEAAAANHRPAVVPSPIDGFLSRRRAPSPGSAAAVASPSTSSSPASSSTEAAPPLPASPATGGPLFGATARAPPHAWTAAALPIAQAASTLT